MTEFFYHGGHPGLRVGDWLAGGHTRQVLNGCAICEARTAGSTSIDPPTQHPDRLYITANRLYAKYYASLYGRGDLYRVFPISGLAKSTEDPIPTWTVDVAEVVNVYDRAVLLSWSERRRLAREWELADREAANA